jgi:hypothetical protein
MVIPCEECIVYAICRTKEEIVCDKFADYAIHMSAKYNADIRPDSGPPDEYWRHLMTIMPYLSRVSPVIRKEL